MRKVVVGLIIIAVLFPVYVWVWKHYLRLPVAPPLPTTTELQNAIQDQIVQRGGVELGNSSLKTIKTVEIENHAAYYTYDTDTPSDEDLSWYVLSSSAKGELNTHDPANPKIPVKIHLLRSIPAINMAKLKLAGSGTTENTQGIVPISSDAWCLLWPDTDGLTWKLDYIWSRVNPPQAVVIGVAQTADSGTDYVNKVVEDVSP